MEVRGFFLIHRGQAADLKNGGLRLSVHQIKRARGFAALVRQHIAGGCERDSIVARSLLEREMPSPHELGCDGRPTEVVTIPGRRR